MLQAALAANLSPRQLSFANAPVEYDPRRRA
jgi:hypothetical protein